MPNKNRDQQRAVRIKFVSFWNQKWPGALYTLFISVVDQLAVVGYFQLAVMGRVLMADPAVERWLFQILYIV